RQVRWGESWTSSWPGRSSSAGSVGCAAQGRTTANASAASHASILSIRIPIPGASPSRPAGIAGILRQPRRPGARGPAGIMNASPVMEKAMHRIIAAMLWLACGCALAQAPGGVVFEDGNGNGLRDDGEAGIAGVAVSNGRDVVRTDAEGRYALPMAPGQTIFVVKPAGWRAPDGADGLPAFWRQQPLAQASGLRY